MRRPLETSHGMRKVSAEVKYSEMDSIEKGIVEFILQHNVRRLVMGAAADRQYSRRMADLKSRKAIYVRLQAADSCQIQFICKGNIIFTRQGKLERPSLSVSPLSLVPNTNSDSGQSSLRSRSVSELQVDSPTRDLARVMSDNRGTRISTFSLPNFNVESTPTSRLNLGWAYNEWSGISQTSPSRGSRLSTCSSEVVGAYGRTPYAISEGSEVESENGAVPGFKTNVQKPSPPSVLQERGMNDELYDQFEQAMAEADNSKQDAFEESIRRMKAEKDAIEAKRRNYKRERDDLQVECDDVLRLLEELREKQTEEASSSSVSQFFTEFDFSEVKEPTRNFDQSLKIGEGGYGSIFRGFLRHTEVAIKMLHSHSLQGPSEFQQEVNVLSKLRHPNLLGTYA